MSQKKQSMNLKTEHRIYSTRETKRIKNSKNSLMDLLAHIKRNNMHIVEIPEVKERKKQNLSEKVIAENIPNLEKETDI